ncbi:MAG: O-antigen ligase family protein [Fretibacterium sp.]|nr:O-antigen ligase family protein [Fretibacterium sp.]
MKNLKSIKLKNGPATRIELKEEPLVPWSILLPLWCVALVLPNLVYSGVLFADTLHILKWTVAGAPVALAVFAAGLRLIRFGREIELKIDIFGVLWGLLLAYCVLQPLWVDVSSMTGLIHEMVCFAAVWVFYVLTTNSFSDRGLRIILWLANINGAINVVFAELQIRNMNDLAFLRGTPFEFLCPWSNVILPTPGNYIGNTAQQNMFGLWMAICVMSSIYLFIAYALAEGGKKRPLWMTVLNLFLMTVNSWGLWNSTSRSALLSLFTGLFVLAVVTAMRYGRAYIRRLSAVLLIFVVVVAGISLYGRAGDLLFKLKDDLIDNVATIGNRVGIWTTSAAMFREHPMGVGVGQYKWHYLEAQREAFKTVKEPWYHWQYTHWAHNEYLQWFCETGWAGGILLVLMHVLWLAAVIRGLWRSVRSREGGVSPTAIWGCALVMLISFDAFWTRPFHRIENILWLALAFALTNREFLSAREWRINSGNLFSRLMGVVLVCGGVAALVYLWSGIEGNMLLRKALNTDNAQLQRYYLEQAVRHPIVREDVRKNLGYHYLQVGDQLHDMETMGKGFNMLWDHFRHEPHSEDMSKLLHWAQRFQVEHVIRELASYLKPGTYHLARRPGTDAQGNAVSALVLLNGPAPEPAPEPESGGSKGVLSPEA